MAPKFAERKADPSGCRRRSSSCARRRRSARSSKRASRRTRRAVPGAAGTARGARRAPRRAPRAVHRPGGPRPARPRSRTLHVRRVAKADGVLPRARLLLSRSAAKADAAVPSRWRKAGAPHQKTPDARATGVARLNDQEPAPEAVTTKKKEEVARTLKPRSWTSILGKPAAASACPVVASRPCTAPAPPDCTRRRAKPIAMSRDEYELSRPAFKARECPGGMARFVFRRPFCVPSTHRWRRRGAETPSTRPADDRHSFTRLAPTPSARPTDTPSTLLSRVAPETPSAPKQHTGPRRGPAQQPRHTKHHERP